MKRQCTHADRTFLPRGHFPKWPNAQLRAKVDLATTTFIELLLDEFAFFSMLLPVFVLAVLVTIPNTLAGSALHEAITLPAARRTQLLGRGGPTLGVGFGIIILSFHRFRAKSNRAAQQLPQLPHL